MKNNTDILCQHILKEKHIRLIKTDLQNIFDKNNSYAADESGNVTGLNLSGQVLKGADFLKDCRTLQWLDLSNNMISDISMLMHLENLTKLNLSQNRITDISCLRELKSLSWVDLRNNRISRLPTDILGWGMEIKWQSEHPADIILAGNPLEEPLIHAIEGGRKALKKYFDEQDGGSGNGTRKEILILAANPKLTPPLRLEEEVRDIEEGLRRSEHRDRFDIRSKWAVRRRDLRRALLDHKPHIVHFSGHGTGEGLKVEDESGFAVTASTEALSDLFELLSDNVECVILNACYSAPQADEISRHINYVIGMQKEIEDKAAIEFAVGFYDALGAGKTIEEAFKFGRNAVQLEFPGQVEHLIPVLKKGNIKDLK